MVLMVRTPKLELSSWRAIDADYEKSGSARGSRVALLRGVQADLIISPMRLCFS